MSTRMFEADVDPHALLDSCHKPDHTRGISVRRCPRVNLSSAVVSDIVGKEGDQACVSPMLWHTLIVKHRQVYQQGAGDCDFVWRDTWSGEKGDELIPSSTDEVYLLIMELQCRKELVGDVESSAQPTAGSTVPDALRMTLCRRIDGLWI